MSKCQSRPMLSWASAHASVNQMHERTKELESTALTAISNNNLRLWDAGIAVSLQPRSCRTAKAPKESAAQQPILLWLVLSDLNPMA